MGERIPERIGARAGTKGPRARLSPAFRRTRGVGASPGRVRSVPGGAARLGGGSRLGPLLAGLQELVDDLDEHTHPLVGDAEALDTPYRAIFCDLLSDQTIDILPLQDVQFDDYIGKAGSLSGTVPIPDEAIAERVRQVEEGRTAVYLERGGDLWWGGIIWTSTLQSSERGVLTLAIQAATFDSYAARRRIREEIKFTTPTDQLEIARTLWNHLQKTDDGNIRVKVGAETSSVKRTAAWRDGWPLPSPRTGSSPRSAPKASRSSSTTAGAPTTATGREPGAPSSA
ncbi:hypothetical protein QFZ82_003479 [Streptomyces sp. V4I23]|nr:hypothetical protein [Streptomyces sp. V4I23]